MVAIVSDTGVLKVQVRYSRYGTPLGLPGGDVDSDGDWDANDASLITGGGAYDVKEDVDLDSDNDVNDASAAGSYYTLGRGALSNVDSRKGYAGYERDLTMAVLHHVRHRVYHNELGRWSRWDPLGYVDGMSVYEYGRSSPHAFVDPFGTACDPTSQCCGKGPDACLGGGARRVPGQPLDPRDEEEISWWQECGKKNSYDGCLTCCEENAAGDDIGWMKCYQLCQSNFPDGPNIDPVFQDCLSMFDSAVDLSAMTPERSCEDCCSEGYEFLIECLLDAASDAHDDCNGDPLCEDEVERQFQRAFREAGALFDRCWISCSLG